MATRAYVLFWVLAAVWVLQDRVAAEDGLGALLEDSAQSQAPTGSPQPDRRLPVPSASASRQALADVKDIFREEYAKATTPQTKASLARQLLGQADKTPAAHEQWMLYSEAMRLASDAGDVDLSFDAIARASESFAVNAEELRLDAVSKLAAKAAPQAIDGLARAALEIAKKASDSGQASVTAKSLSVASALARKAKNRTLMVEVTKIQQSTRDQEKESREKAGIEAKLAADPGNPEMCLEAGKYFCFKAGDWARGLPLLAKGSDTDLARLAVAEMNVGKTVEAVVSLADAWWDWADHERGSAKSSGMVRAADHYERIVAKTAGLDRVRLEKRIKEAQGESAGRREKRMFLADVQEESRQFAVGPFTKDGTYNGAPFIFQNKSWPKSLTFVAYEKGPSVIYKIPPGAKRLVGRVGIFTPAEMRGTKEQPKESQHFEILVDGQSAWKSPPLANRDDAAEFDVPLYESQKLELRVTSKNIAYSWTTWLDPEIVF